MYRNESSVIWLIRVSHNCTILFGIQNDMSNTGLTRKRRKKTRLANSRKPLFSDPHFQWGEKSSVAFFFQILPNLHAPSLDYLVT